MDDNMLKSMQINQSLINLAAYNSTKTLSKRINSMTKKLKRTNKLVVFSMILTGVGGLALLLEMKAEKDETQYKLKKLETKIKELEEGE